MPCSCDVKLRNRRPFRLAPRDAGRHILAVKIMRHDGKIQRWLLAEAVRVHREPHLAAIFHQSADIDAAIAADEEIGRLQRKTITAELRGIAYGNADGAVGIGCRVRPMRAAEAAHICAQPQNIQSCSRVKNKREIAAMAAAGELVLGHACKLARKQKRRATRNRMAPPEKSRSCYSAAFLPFFASSS